MIRRIAGDQTIYSLNSICEVEMPDKMANINNNPNTKHKQKCMVWAKRRPLKELLLRCNGTQCRLHKELGLSEVHVKNDK